jgi:shikimate kinase
MSTPPGGDPQLHADRHDRHDGHIAFIGFMGAGKSTMAERVARRLGRAWFDTDEVIVKRCGRTIPELFAAGEQAQFRATEKQVIAELLTGEPAVLSLGGGALEDADTRDALFARAFVVNLAVSWEDVRAELPTLMLTRPLLQDRTEEEIHDLFERRQATYNRAHLRVHAPRGDLDAAAEYVLSMIMQ